MINNKINKEVLSKNRLNIFLCQNNLTKTTDNGIILCRGEILWNL